MTRQTGNFEYTLKYSNCKRLSCRYYHGQFRVYAPEGTPPEAADEFARRHYIEMKLTAALEERAQKPKWPGKQPGRHIY